MGYGEETRNTTMGKAVERAGTVDAAVVGEPTNLDAAVAQRGLMMADLIGRGDQRHAGYAARRWRLHQCDYRAGAGPGPRSMAWSNERLHPMLGVTTVTPTMLSAGVSRNVTPPAAKAVLDIRSTPAWPHDELGDGARRRGWSASW